MLTVSSFIYIVTKHKTSSVWRTGGSRLTEFMYLRTRHPALRLESSRTPRFVGCRCMFRLDSHWGLRGREVSLDSWCRRRAQFGSLREQWRRLPGKERWKRSLLLKGIRSCFVTFRRGGLLFSVAGVIRLIGRGRRFQKRPNVKRGRNMDIV